MSAPTEKWSKQDIAAISTSVAKNIKAINQALSVIEDRSAWHKKQHTALKNRTTAAEEDAKKLKTVANKPKGDKGNAVDPDKLASEVESILKDAKEALDAKVKITYYYGTTKYDKPADIEREAKAALPESDKKFASQAVHDAVTNSNPKDASRVAGTGVKHASSGTKNVGSCTIFFKWEDLKDGLKRKFTVVAVGGHAGSSSYKIYETFTPKLKKDATVSL